MKHQNTSRKEALADLLVDIILDHFECDYLEELLKINGCTEEDLRLLELSDE